jgi:hypothetical protein
MNFPPCDLAKTLVYISDDESKVKRDTIRTINRLDKEDELRLTIAAVKVVFP